MNHLNLNLLKYFYEVVNQKNITKASEILMISQPAVTKAIKELEKSLGVKLLQRNKKGVEPTLEGTILYEKISIILTDLDKTVSRIENIKSKNKTLFIGTTTTNFTIFLIEPLRKFRIKYPDVHINIVLDEIKNLEELSRLGKLDIVIKNDYEEIKNFKNIKSFAIEDKFIASKRHFKELEHQEYSLEQLLNNYPFVLLSNITHGRKNFDKYLKNNNIEYKPTYEFNSYSLCRELVKEGFGIGIGNPIHYQSDDYIIIKTNFNLPSRSFNIGYLSNSTNEYIKKFKDLFQ